MSLIKIEQKGCSRCLKKDRFDCICPNGFEVKVEPERRVN